MYSVRRRHFCIFPPLSSEFLLPLLISKMEKLLFATRRNSVYIFDVAAICLVVYTVETKSYCDDRGADSSGCFCCGSPNLDPHPLIRPHCGVLIVNNPPHLLSPLEQCCAYPASIGP